MTKHFLYAALALAACATAVSAQPKLDGLTSGPAPTSATGTEPSGQPKMPPETVLADNGIARVTRADYDLELTRLPANIRAGFATSEKRVADLINRLLVTKTLAAQADQRGIPKEPEVARRIEAEFERVKAQMMTQRIEQEAAQRFDADVKRWELRARDVYALDPKKFEVAEQVSASHILFAFSAHKPDEARKLAAEARAAVLAGKDFNELAREKSEDGSAKQNAGRLGFFGAKQMDPNFEQAAFALARVGDLSEPVESAYGWHVIRLDGRHPAKRQTFDEAKPAIMADLKQKYVTAERDRIIDEIRQKAYEVTRMDLVDPMVIRVDYDKVEQLQRDVLQRLRERERATGAK
jgi:peptidyl-prolyl cis-trans isomerase C